jgi:hypothetical protein
VLSGPDGAAGWLPYGGVVVLDDGDHLTLPSPPLAADDQGRRGSRAKTRSATPVSVSRP